MMGNDDIEPRAMELSEREKEILIQVASGASNKEIANALSISSNTVKVHLRNIFAKINAASRTEAAMYAIKAGYIPGAQAELSTEQAAEPQQEDETGEAPTQIQAFQQNRRKMLRITTYASVLIFVVIIGMVAILYRPSNTTAAGTPTSGPAWVSFTSLEIARSGAAAAAGDNLIYLIGGRDAQSPLGLSEAFSLATRSWTALPEKPTAVSFAGAVVIGGEIYVPGGLAAGDQPTQVFEIFDIAKNEWTIGPELPFPLYGYASCAFEGRMYIFGGIRSDGLSEIILRFDPDTQEWEQIGALPSPFAFGGATVIGNSIYIVGGWDGRDVLTATHIYAPTRETDQWKTGPSLPEPRMKMGIAAIADIIHVTGGNSTQDGQSILLETLALSPGGVQWQSLGDGLAQQVESPVLVSQGAILYLIGGVRGGQPSSEVKAFQAIFTTLIPMIIK